MGGPGSGRRPGDVSALERFFAKVDTSGDCWAWRGATTPGGYGLFHVGRGTEIASRVAFEAAVGRIPDGLQVAHLCDNPPCVRPSHLFLATLQENIDDAVAKGRMNYGHRNAWATMPERMRMRRPPTRLSDEQVALIRSRHAAGESMGRIARSMDVTTAAVSLIVRGRRHLWPAA